MTPAQQQTIDNFRKAAAMGAEELKKKLLDGRQLTVDEAFWLEKAASKFSARTPLEMCQALIDRQALSEVTKRLKT